MLLADALCAIGVALALLIFLIFFQANQKPLPQLDTNSQQTILECGVLQKRTYFLLSRCLFRRSYRKTIIKKGDEKNELTMKGTLCYCNVPINDIRDRLAMTNIGRHT